MSERVFIGRKDELASLQNAWHRAKAGHPQMVVILAETGLGKTRLVQEFYGWLSETDIEDPNGYWPDNLPIGASLGLNPPADAINLKVQIPWLWWGMRFHSVDERNQDPIRRSPFEAEDPNLTVHAEPIMLKRKINTNNKKAAKSFLGMFADFSTGGMASIGGTLNELWQQRNEQNTAIKELAFDAARLVEKRSEEINESVLGLLRLFLDKKITDAPTVPVILVLDDAQWSDPATAKSIDSILTKAARYNWQILIIATHWKREWEQLRLRHESGQEDLGSFFQTFQSWSSLSGNTPEAASLLLLEPLDPRSLLPVVSSRLPGILDEHKERLLVEADGNPRALEEMIQLLVPKPQYFQDNNSRGALSPLGIRRLAQLENTSLFDKVWQRFDEISTDIQDVLACGSMFGASFLGPMVEEILQRCDLDEHWSLEDQVKEKLVEAERIHSLIQNLSKHNHNFQQRIYHQVAANYLKGDAALKAARQRTLDARISHWLQPDNLSKFEPEEQETFLAFVVAHYLSAPDSHQGLARESGKAFSSYLKRLNARGAEAEIIASWEKVAAKLESLADAFVWHAAYAAEFALVVARNEQEGQQKARMLLESLDQAVTSRHADDLLREPKPDVKGPLSDYFREFTSQRDVASAYALQSYGFWSGFLDQFGEIPEHLGEVSRSLERLGILAEEVDGDAATARKHFVKSLALRRRIVEQLGETPKRLRDVGVSLHRLGSLTLDVDGKAASAREYFEGSLELFQRVLEQFGETPKRLRDVSQLIAKIGELALDIDGDAVNARKHFEESLVLNRRIVEQFGETPERLRDVSVALVQMGDLTRDIDGDAATARKHFEESLALDQKMLRLFGETPERLRDVSVALDRIGLLARNIDGDAAAARKHFEESLALRRRIIEQFGETPERLRDVSVSLDQIGALTFRVDRDAVNARKHFEESLVLNRRILKQFGETPERLRDVSVSLKWIGILAEEVDGDAATARKHFEESLALRRRIVQQFGETPERLRGVGVSLDKIGDLALNLDGDAATAREHFEESLALCQSIIENFGETPERLDDVTKALKRIENLR